MLRIISVCLILMLSSCTTARYALAPQKESTLSPYFESKEAASDYLKPLTLASVDIITGISSKDIEHARENGMHISIEGQSSIASGTVVDDGNLVLTAAHVLREGQQVTVSERGLEPGLITDAEIVWCSKLGDLAALKPRQQLTHSTEWVDSVEVGETVFLIGIFQQHSVGQVLAVDEILPGILSVKHSAPIRGGDSGGPLLTRDGRLVAINTGIQFGALRYKFSEGRRLESSVDVNDCY